MPENEPRGKEPAGASEFLARFSVGQDIFREKDTGSEMYIVKEGQVEILKSLHGVERRIAVLEEGDFFGEMALLEDQPRTATARALTACALVRIDGSTFDHMVRHNPEIPVRMLRKLCRRLRDTNRQLLDAEAMPHAPVEEVSPGFTVNAPIEEVTEKEAQLTEAKLIAPETGTEFSLSYGPETFIGRYDAATGFQPEIDLKPIDTKRTTSRRHARIIRRGGDFFLKEEIGTANGTLLNGVQVRTGVETEIHDGDRLQFGLVKTVLHVG